MSVESTDKNFERKRDETKTMVHLAAAVDFLFENWDLLFETLGARGRAGPSSRPGVACYSSAETHHILDQGRRCAAAGINLQRVRRGAKRCCARLGPFNKHVNVLAPPPFFVPAGSPGPLLGSLVHRDIRCVTDGRVFKVWLGWGLVCVSYPAGDIAPIRGRFC